MEEDSDEDALFPGCSNEPRRDMSYSPEIAPRRSEASVNSTIESNVSKPGTPKERPLNNDPDSTPSRILQDISPIPQRLAEIRKRAKQVGTLMTSEAHISARKCAEEKKREQENTRKIH